MQQKTFGDQIANSINNMPLALGNSRKSTVEALDLLTPNRLKLGRNNERSPEGCVTVDHPDRILEENQNIFNAWFEIWLTGHVPKLIDQPKWFKSDQNLKPGDIVLFLKQESVISSNNFKMGWSRKKIFCMRITKNHINVHAKFQIRTSMYVVAHQL